MDEEVHMILQVAEKYGFEYDEPDFPRVTGFHRNRNIELFEYGMGDAFAGPAPYAVFVRFDNPARLELSVDYHGSRFHELAINRWVRSMGVMVKTIEYKQDKQSGVYSGADRHEHKPEEAPGISPLLIRHWVDHCVWLGLEDLAFSLPEYSEIPLPVSLPPEVQAHYDHERMKLLDYLLACRDEGDASFLGAYLQAVLRYPSTCYQARPVFHRTLRKDAQGNPVTRLVTTLEGFGDGQVYPKEQALIDLLREELAAGPPVLGVHRPERQGGYPGAARKAARRCAYCDPY